MRGSTLFKILYKMVYLFSYYVVKLYKNVMYETYYVHKLWIHQRAIPTKGTVKALKWENHCSRFLVTYYFYYSVILSVALKLDVAPRRK